MGAERIGALLVQGDLDGARRELRAAFAPGAPAEPAWAVAAEAAGLSELAIQAWRAVLAHRPDDADALLALLRLHELRGDDRRAEACRRRLIELGGAPARDEGPAPEPELQIGPSPGDLVRFVHLFAGRAGVHARMWSRDGRIGYGPVQASLDPALVEAHLRGETTVGSYLVRQSDVTGQLVLDLDASQEAVARAEGHPDRVRDLAGRLHTAGLQMRRGLEAAGVPCLLVDSGYKGRHVWVFLDPPAPAGAVRRLGLAWAAALAPADPELAIEVFPKQDRVEAGGLGNLVKLPLGRHLRTGRRCVLLDAEGRPIDDPWPVLRGLRPTDLGRIPLPGPPVVAAAHPLVPYTAALPAVPVAAPVPFTEADLEARPRISAVLGGCAVLRDVVQRMLASLRVGRDERLVLENTLGHWVEGVEATNWLLDRAAADPPRMGRPLQSNPASCKGIRRRLSEVADRVGCACPFDAPDTYPTPLLHARGVPATAPAPPPDLEEVLERLGRLERRAREIEAELAALRTTAADGLRRAPGGRFRSAAGTWWVEDVEGMPIVRYTPDAG